MVCIAQNKKLCWQKEVNAGFLFAIVLHLLLFDAQHMLRYKKEIKPISSHKTIRPLRKHENRLVSKLYTYLKIRRPHHRSWHKSRSCFFAAICKKITEGGN